MIGNFQENKFLLNKSKWLKLKMWYQWSSYGHKIVGEDFNL